MRYKERYGRQVERDANSRVDVAWFEKIGHKDLAAQCIPYGKASQAHIAHI